MSGSGLQFHADGCIAANIPTRVYAVTYQPRCRHAQVAGAVVQVRAVSAAAALEFAAEWLRLPENTPAQVTIPAS